MRRLGFNLRWLMSISSISSSAWVQCSRGDFDQFLQRFVSSPASIWSQLSIECKGVTKNWWIFSKLLNLFTIQSKVGLQGERTSFYRKFPAKNADCRICLKEDQRLRLREIRGPRSHVSQVFCPFDLDQSVLMRPRVIPWIVKRAMKSPP